MYLFELGPCLYAHFPICPGVGFLPHRGVLCLVFWGTSILFPIGGAQKYIPTGGVGGFPALLTFSSVCCLETAGPCPCWLGWAVPRCSCHVPVCAQRQNAGANAEAPPAHCGGSSPLLASSHRPGERGALRLTRLFPWPPEDGGDTSHRDAWLWAPAAHRRPCREELSGQRSTPVPWTLPHRGVSAETLRLAYDQIMNEWAEGETLPWTLYICFLCPALWMGTPVKVFLFCLCLFYLIPVHFHWKPSSPGLIKLSSKVHSLWRKMTAEICFFLTPSRVSGVCGGTNNWNQNSDYPLPVW